MTEKVCAICSDPIPNYPREALIELGFSGFQNKGKKQEIFCPLHNPIEIAKYIEKSVMNHA